MSGAGSRVACRYHPDAVLIEDYHAGDLVCEACGLVVADRVIDVGSEWRTFSNDKNAKDMSRVGAAENPLLEGGELSTIIATTRESTAFDENGKPLYKNKRNLSSTDRTLMHAFSEIGQMAERLNLPRSVSDQANAIFKQVHKTKNLRGRSNDAVASACLYMASRQEGVARTFKEVCAVSRVSKKEIGKVFKKILKTLETNVQSVSVEDFMTRFCSNLELPTQVRKVANEIAKKAADIDLVAGRSPVSIAAAAIYMAAQSFGIKKEKKEIGDIAGVAEATISLSYRLMRPKAHELFPKDFNLVSLDILPIQ